MAQNTVEDIWTNTGTLVYLSAAETMEIASTNANDTSAGTGAQTVSIEGVDGTGAALTEIVSLNGTTDVTTLNSFYRVNRMKVLTVGSDASGSNIGDITATATTSATVQCHMLAGTSLSMNSHYTVPLGKTGLVYRGEFNCVRTSAGFLPLVEFKCMMREHNGPWIEGFGKRFDTEVSIELDVDLIHPSVLPERSEIRITAIADQNDTEIRTRTYILLVDND
jgi:hypothetical protein